MKMKTSREVVSEARPAPISSGASKKESTDRRCILNFTDQVIAGNEEIIRDIPVGAKLAVVVSGKDVLLLERGIVVGALNKNIETIKSCIYKGYSYEAEVTLSQANPPLLQVRVRTTRRA